jgi:hypothetical protein
MDIIVTLLHVVHIMIVPYAVIICKFAKERVKII